MAGKLKLRDETFRRQENRRVCSGRREELFQQLGGEGQELFLPMGVKLGCEEKGKGSLQMERGGLREEKCGGGYSSSWEGRARSFSSGGGELGCGEKEKGSLQMERDGLREESAGRRLFQQLGPQEGQELFLPAGVKLGCGEKEKGSLQMERGGLREENAGRGLFQQLGAQEGQELFLPAGDLDLGHGEEGSGLCLSEVFEVAEGQELPVLFVQPL